MTEQIVYRETFLVADTDADINDFMKSSALLRYAQQMATDHSNAVGLDDAFYKREKLAFLLGMQSLRFDRLPKRCEKLTMLSIPEQNRRGTNKRVTLVQDEEGNEIAQVDSRWILIDTEKRQIIRHPPMCMERFWNPVVERELPQKMPRVKECEPCGVWRAEYSRCDGNRHLNNTFYLDIACDALPLEELREHPVQAASVRYHREILVGETFEVERGRLENGWYIAGRRQGALAFEVCLSFAQNIVK